MTVPGVSVIILTKNEELHIGRAIASAHLVANEIFVVDSYSSDNTVEIACRAGATVLQNTFVNQAKQFKWALENCHPSSDWVMRLDADEVLSLELVQEITARLHSLPLDVTGINLKRRHVFLGRWIKHGGRYPVVLLRIWRNGAAMVEQRWMDEHILLLHGRAISFQADFSDINLSNLSAFTDKHNRYATREALDLLIQRHDLAPITNKTDLSSAQAATTRWIKEKLYNRLPLGFGPLAYFLFRYFVQLGFLDGREGLIYHFLQGFWYRFLVASKVMELDRALSSLPSREQRVKELANLSGYRRADITSQTLQADLNEKQYPNSRCKLKGF